MNDEQMGRLESDLKSLLPGIPFTVGGRDREYFRRAIVEFVFTDLTMISKVLTLIGEIMEGRSTVANCVMYRCEADHFADRWIVTMHFRDKDFRFDI